MKKNPFRSLRRSVNQPDDISISDSLCSGILRGELGIGNKSKARSTRATNSVTGPGSMADFSKELAGSTSSSLKDESINESEELTKREDRKQRIKERLENYKTEQKQLKSRIQLLERQLTLTADKLREVDSEAAAKIDTLESELSEQKKGMEVVAIQSSREVNDQSECIKSLGKKLIRQAHVIKSQKNAVNEYKIQMQAMHEEMEMQDERDSKREEEHDKLKEDYERVKEQTEDMRSMLQSNIEEMIVLKQETENDAKSVMELEFSLQQKDATLERVARESSEKSQLIAKLQDELEEKTCEAEISKAELQASETDAKRLREELKSKAEEAEEIQCKFATWGEAGTGQSNNSLSRHQSEQISTFGMSGSDSGEVEVLEAELQAKDSAIHNLDCTIKEHEETIANLRSDSVKMSSTYKQDSYLKRKEIAKLKQANAEYALKLRALEKAFKGVSSTEINTSLHGVGTSLHGTLFNSGARSESKASIGQVKSMHGISRSRTKEDKAAALRARLGGSMGGLDLHNFSSQQANDVDHMAKDESSIQGSDDGRKGEVPEEC